MTTTEERTKLAFYYDSLLLGYCEDIRVSAFNGSNGVRIETDVLYFEKPSKCKYQLRIKGDSIIVMNDDGSVFIISNNYSLFTGQKIDKKEI